jgi:hypothetical protein
MDDPELQALQRQLDDAFETTRPRRGFEDQLWLKLQARRPFWTRARDGVAGLLGGIREVPAVPAATVAVVLIVAVGVGVLALGGGFHGGNSSAGAGLSAHAPGPAYNQADAAFGRLPSPPFNPGSGGPPEAAVSGPAQWYAGPVNLTWTGQLDYSIQTAPVYRYAEPGAQSANAFAATLGATPEERGNGHIGTYTTSEFQLQVDGTTPSPTLDLPPRAPTYFALFYPTTRPTVPAGTGLADFAAAYLAQHGLTPQWPFTVDTSSGVLFLRQFAVPGYPSPAYVIDSSGRHVGLEVDFIGDQLARVVGPLPIGLDSTNYRIISADQAVRAALAPSPPPVAGEPARPTVQLTRAELVYALAPAGAYSYYEPALLFSGTFTFQGYTVTKAVLVPLVDPSLRS